MACVRSNRSDSTLPFSALRQYHDEICKLLDTSDELLQSLATGLFSENIVNEKTKNRVLRDKGFTGANILMDSVRMKVEQNPNKIKVVLKVMQRQELLSTIVEGMRRILIPMGTRRRLHRNQTNIDEVSESYEDEIETDPEDQMDSTNTMATSLLLIGKVGQGKSTLGNFIVRNSAFKTNHGFASVTGESKLASFSYQGKEYEIIDTPGFCDSKRVLTDTEALIEVAKGIKLSFGNEKQGVDAVLLVFSATDRFCNNAEDLLSCLDELPNLWSYTIVVITKAESLESNDPKKKLFEMIEEPRTSPSLKSLVEKVEKRIVLLNAKDTSEDNYKMKMNELLPIIEEIQEKNDYQPYTSTIFKEAAEAIKKKQKLLDMTREELEKKKEDVIHLRNTIEQLHRKKNDDDDDFCTIL